jgi:hypothetical protein
MVCNQIPYANEQGIFKRVSGKIFQGTGISRNRPIGPMPHRRRSTRRCVRGQLMYSPRDRAVIDAEPVGAGVDSEAVEIFDF